MHRRCKLNPSNAIKCSVDFYFEYLIFNLCNQILVAATCLLVDVCHDMCNPLVQLKEERRQTMVGRHWERNWKEKGTISLEHSESFQSSFREKKTLSFSQKRNTIFLESLNLLGIDLISLEIKFYIWKSTPKKYIQIDLEIKHYMFRISYKWN